MNIRERRIDALSRYKDHANSNQTKELLNFFIAAAPHSLVKEAVEYFNIEL